MRPLQLLLLLRPLLLQLRQPLLRLLLSVLPALPLLPLQLLRLLLRLLLRQLLLLPCLDSPPPKGSVAWPDQTLTQNNTNRH